jgi:hypothetical protein
MKMGNFIPAEFILNILFSVTIPKFNFMSKILITINEKCQSVLNKFSRLKNLLNFYVCIILTCKLVVS